MVSKCVHMIFCNKCYTICYRLASTGLSVVSSVQFLLLTKGYAAEEASVTEDM
jgi:hypothetical protein